MYKFNRNRQIDLKDFNQPLGLKMNEENRWVIKAKTIPWDEIEEKYAKLFPSKTWYYVKFSDTFFVPISINSSIVVELILYYHAIPLSAAFNLK